jgi:hypothetical protein
MPDIRSFFSKPGSAPPSAKKQAPPKVRELSARLNLPAWPFVCSAARGSPKE